MTDKKTTRQNVSCSVWLKCRCSIGRYFKQNVSWQSSTVKISDEVPRDARTTIDTVFWTSELEAVFRHNADEDPQLRLYLGFYSQIKQSTQVIFTRG